MCFEILGVSYKIVEHKKLKSISCFHSAATICDAYTSTNITLWSYMHLLSTFPLDGIQSKSISNRQYEKINRGLRNLQCTSLCTLTTYFHLDFGPHTIHHAKVFRFHSWLSIYRNSINICYRSTGSGYQIRCLILSEIAENIL